ncbi:hypothetical protein BDF19DRAFT_227097 [Syncephalis fuscata]|nr:hypothetical protein BDF19DRAFT_227097 [Syncephalis fuscata]
MANMFTGGADCSGGNAMTGLLKQYSRDRSLQQDHMARDMQQGRGGHSIFRQGARPNNALTEEFLRDSNAQAGPSTARNVFEFNALGKELDLLEGPPPLFQNQQNHQQQQQQPNNGLGNWANDFVHEGHIATTTGDPLEHAEWSEFDRAFDAAQAHTVNGWESEFSKFEEVHHDGHQLNNPELQEQFEKAFEQAGQDVNWESEFTKQQESNWAEEFDKEVNGDGDSRAALAATAGQVVDIVNESSNPKFKQSNFLQFMRRLRDQEVVVEGNKVVEQHAPNTSATGSWSAEFAQKSTDWSNEFATTPSKPDQTGNWAHEFNGEASTSAQPAANWTSEFAKNEDWAASFVEHQTEATTNTAVGDQWAREFEEIHRTSSTAPAESMAPITSEQDRLDEWTEMYRKNIAHLADEPVDKEWEELAKAWEQQELRGDGRFSLQAVGREYDEYPFQVDNPFLQDRTTSTAASSPGRGRSLHEEILEHEAVVQLNPDNAEAWRRLGLLQQENERDSAAIAAFRQAIKHNTMANADASSHNVSVALAIAYANESCRNDAYAELERWITEHPIYGRATGKAPIAQQDNTLGQHERVEAAMLRAVQAQPDNLDAELQAGLGVLFNLSNEPMKAVDCFQAAVQARPGDHFLWNRLGASLANCGDYMAAVDAYRRALELRPGYVRARYNIGISCINLGHHREAAGHLLTALALQSPSAKPYNTPAITNNPTTDSLWTALRMTMNLLNRPDLANECDRRDLGVFQKEFEF